MDIGQQMAAMILEAIASGRDLYVLDYFITGPDRLERARALLTERRDASSDPDEVALLTAILGALPPPCSSTPSQS